MAFGGNLNPVAGLGTTLDRGDGGDPIEIFYSIAEVISLSGPSMAQATIDASTITSPANHVQYIPGQVKGGRVTLGVNFLPKDTSHLGLISDLKSGALRNFRLVFPDGVQSSDSDESLNSVWEFAAYVTGFNPSVQLTDRITASIGLTLDGEAVI